MHQLRASIILWEINQEITSQGSRSSQNWRKKNREKIARRLQYYNAGQSDGSILYIVAVRTSVPLTTITFLHFQIILEKLKAA